MKNLHVLILAAGKGTRMISNRAKVLHTICGAPILRHIYRAASGIDLEGIVIVIGYDAERVCESLEGLLVRFVF